MADSDNSTTLPALINRWRRRCASADTLIPGQDAAVANTSAMLSADPAIELFRDWRETHHAASVLCRLQQRSERHTLRQERRRSPDAGAVRRRLAERSHEVSRTAELAAMDAEELLIAALASTPAQSLTGVLTKLQMIARAGEDRGMRTEFPWPQIKSAVEDLRDVLAEGQGGARIG